jgi:hypothetical protein
VGQESIHPKGIAREIIEQYCSFQDYVRSLGLHRAEGVLLRYLTQVYKVLTQTVPEQARTEEVYDCITFFGTMLEEVDSSLVDEWELMKLRAGGGEELAPVEAPVQESTQDRGRSVLAQIRRAMHELLRALSTEDYTEALRCIENDPEDPWDEARFYHALDGFYTSYEEIVFTPEARRSNTTRITPVKPGVWSVQQTLLDSAGDNFWHIDAEVSLGVLADPNSLRVRILGIGS